MDLKRLRESIGEDWDQSILDCLMTYVRIPNKSPAFDPNWESHGHMDAAVQLVADWCRRQSLPKTRVEILRQPGRTPLLFVDVPGELPGCVLLYGHLDKQPEFTGWRPGLGPWEPVLQNGKLYGRGTADDGYAVFSSVAAIAALKKQQVPLARCVLLIETCEESSSVDLPLHLEALGDSIGHPSLVVCLDSECGNYSQIWCTTSLRGNVIGCLRVRVLTEGVHSGLAGGIVPSPFSMVSHLLARIADPVTGELLLDELRVGIPADRRAQAAAAAKVLGPEIAGKVPWAPGAQPLSEDPAELLMNSTWRGALAVIGADGLPSSSQAGCVLLPELAVKLSLRIPPTTDPALAAKVLSEVLEREPPFGAQVKFELESCTAGWNSPSFAPWLSQSIARASQAVFNREALHIGCGGSIPFMRMLGTRFPSAQFFITGVLGPHSNAHGPNEFLQIDYAKKLTESLAMVLADHAKATA